MAARQPNPDAPDQTQALTDRTEPQQRSDGPTVALVHTHIDGAFHSGVDGAPDPITADPQPINADLVDKVKAAAKSADVAITVKGN